MTSAYATGHLLGDQCHPETHISYFPWEFCRSQTTETLSILLLKMCYSVDKSSRFTGPEHEINREQDY